MVYFILGAQFIQGNLIFRFNFGQHQFIKETYNRKSDSSFCNLQSWASDNKECLKMDIGMDKYDIQYYI